MQTGIHLIQEQRQQLVMTPELRQALSILQYPATELNAYLKEQVTENPVLDWEEGEFKKPVGEGTTTSWKSVRNRKHDREPGKWWENVSVHQSLLEQMEEQLRFSRLESEEKRIARFMLGNLDERGYLNISITEVCNRFNISAEWAERILSVLQQFEPAGICARHLRECLLLQIERMPEAGPLLKQVVQHHLPQLADGRWKQVANVLGCEQKELQDVVDCLRRLDPNPGLQLIHDPGHYVIPDVIIEEVNGDHVISVNDQIQGRLRFHPEYEPLRFIANDQSRQVKQYLSERFQAADWLFRSLESRRQTLIKITEVILKRQRAFFAHGIAFLKPMTLQDVALTIDLHESTVSRAIRDKYVQAPRGLIPFKLLFSSGLATAGGEGTSREGVKEHIKQIVQNENKAKPLSDQQLANALIKMGVRISRRTVTKYREELAIPSSTKRKRLS